MYTRPRNRKLDGHLRRNLTKCVRGVDHQQTAEILHDVRHGVGHNAARLQSLEVKRYQSDAMRGHAIHFGGHQRVHGEACVGGRNTG